MKNAIITGSSKGLGRAIALSLAKEGYVPWLTARNEVDLQNLTAEILTETGVKSFYHVVDFSDQKQVEAYVNVLKSSEEGFEVLVNNAGVYIPDELTDEQPALDLQMQVNFHAAYCITQALLPQFIANEKGHIFNVCSIVNRKPRVEAASYTISKFALYGYHQLLHERLKKHKVKVTAFFPGSINTSSWDGIEAPKEDFVQPEDIASMLVGMLKMKLGTVPSEIDLNSINPAF